MNVTRESEPININVHYNDVIMGTMASHVTSLTIVYTTVNSGADQRKHQSSASLAFVWGIHWWPVNSPHKGPVTRKMFPFDDVIMWERMRLSVLWNLLLAEHWIYAMDISNYININLWGVIINLLTSTAVWTFVGVRTGNYMKRWCNFLSRLYSLINYRKISNISRTKSQKLNGFSSRLAVVFAQYIEAKW